MWKHKSLRISKTNLNNKDTTEAINIPDFKSHYKATGMSMVVLS